MSLVKQSMSPVEVPTLEFLFVSICIVPGTMWRYQGREHTKTNQKASALHTRRLTGGPKTRSPTQPQPQKQYLCKREQLYTCISEKDYMYIIL